MRHIVSVINQKGGVGKTTTSINLSAGLAMKGHSVLLIDLDPQSHSTIGLGLEPGQHLPAIHDVLLRKKTIHEIILPTKIEGLFIAPSHIRLDRAEQQITPEMFKETFLYRSVKDLGYDFILIDCRPTLGTLTINALFASGFVIIPCEIGRYSLEGFSDLLETIEDVKSFSESSDDKDVRILLTKFDSRNKISNEWFFEQLEPYREWVLPVMIRRNEAINQAHMAQEPIFFFRPESKGARDYALLTEEFLRLCRKFEKN